MRKFKNILVTGGLGFIGINFCDYLLKNYDLKIINIDKKTYASNNSTIHHYDKKYKLYKIDIADKKKVNDLFLRYNFDAVVHFAAETHVDNSIKNSERFIKSNIIGTHNLLEASLKFLKIKNKKNFVFLHISTDEVFGHLKKNDKSFTEKTAYQPRNPYSATKASSDHLVRSFYSTYEFPAIVVNCCNNFGPFQNKEKLIPKTIHNIIKKKKIPIYGKGKQIREWIFVEDFVNAILKVLQKGKVGESYNIGSGKEFENIHVVNLICEIIKEKKILEYDPKKLIAFVKDRSGHDFRYSINSSKVKKELNWVCKTSFKKGIEKTIEYYLHEESSIKDKKK